MHRTHFSIKLYFRHLQSVSLAIFLTEAEHNDGGKITLHNHLDDPKAVGLSFESTVPALGIT